MFFITIHHYSVDVEIYVVTSLLYLIKVPSCILSNVLKAEKLPCGFSRIACTSPRFPTINFTE